MRGMALALAAEPLAVEAEPEDVGMSSARLRNISSGGALVESREELPVGAEIQLDFAAGGLIDGTVVWARASQFGVQFRDKFDLKLLQSIKGPAAKSATVMTPDYLKDLDASQGK